MWPHAEGQAWPRATVPRTLRALSACLFQVRIDLRRHETRYVYDAMKFGVFRLGDARSFLGLTSKLLPFGSMLNFDADVKNMNARHQCENRYGKLELSAVVHVH